MGSMQEGSERGREHQRFGKWPMPQSLLNRGRGKRKCTALTAMRLKVCAPEASFSVLLHLAFLWSRKPLCCWILTRSSVI